MIARIKKGLARGKVSAPPSKSMAHRLLICAAMSEGVSTVRGVSSCEDALATVDCLRALGAEIEAVGDTYTVRGVNIRQAAPTRELYCRESGSTLRFLIPVAALSQGRIALSGAESLMKRPLSVYGDIFADKEIVFEKTERFVFVEGPLKPGEYTLRGDVSSQFISGLLFALPLLDSDSVIKILPPFESRSYVELTLAALKKFGVKAEFSDGLTIKIKGNQKYTTCDVTVEGDYSGAAFTDAFNLIGGEVSVSGLKKDSRQGDKIYKELYKRLPSGKETIDISDCPDLGPILFTLAAALNGARFTGTARLRIKESDRAVTMKEELEKFGADIEFSENSVTVKKAPLHSPCEPLYGHNDHRVVMSLAVLLSLFGGEIHGAEAISKSYPSFFDDIGRLGIEVKLND